MSTTAPAGARARKAKSAAAPHTANATPAGDFLPAVDAWLKWFTWPADSQSTGGTDGLALKGVPPSAPPLEKATVLAIGLGAVGGRAFARFAQAGVGTLIGVDVDHYGADSWMTQRVCRGRDAGRSKAQVQGERAHALNPAVRVITAEGLAQHLPLWAFHRADVVVIAADNLEVVVGAAVRAAAVGKRVLEGAVHGEAWLSLVRAYDLTDTENACPGCGLGQREWGMLRSRVGCDPKTIREQGIEPTRTLPVACAAAAELLAAEALKGLYGLQDAQLRSEELAYCLLSHKVRRTVVERNPDCPCPHTRWELIEVARGPEEVTLDALKKGLAGRGRWLVQGELPWVSFTLCGDCQRGPIPVRRFGRPGDAAGRCPCGRPLLATPLGIRSIVPPGDVHACRDVPLSQLDLPPGGAVGFCGQDRTVYCFVGQPLVLRDQPRDQPPPTPNERRLS